MYDMIYNIISYNTTYEITFCYGTRKKKYCVEVQTTAEFHVPCGAVMRLRYTKCMGGCPKIMPEILLILYRKCCVSKAFMLTIS